MAIIRFEPMLTKKPNPIPDHLSCKNDYTSFVFMSRFIEPLPVYGLVIDEHRHQEKD